MSMVEGFNTDVRLGNINYHFQTEDWGSEKPCFVTSIFKAGVLLKSIKIAYRDVFKDLEDVDFITIRSVLKTQHEFTVKWAEEQFKRLSTTQDNI